MNQEVNVFLDVLLVDVLLDINRHYLLIIRVRVLILLYHHMMNQGKHIANSHLFFGFKYRPLTSFTSFDRMLFVIRQRNKGEVNLFVALLYSSISLRRGIFFLNYTLRTVRGVAILRKTEIDLFSRRKTDT